MFVRFVLGFRCTKRNVQEYVMILLDQLLSDCMAFCHGDKIFCLFCIVILCFFTYNKTYEPNLKIYSVELNVKNADFCYECQRIPSEQRWIESVSYLQIASADTLKNPDHGNITRFQFQRKCRSKCPFTCITECVSFVSFFCKGFNDNVELTVEDLDECESSKII